MSRSYFNDKAESWDEKAAEKDFTKLDEMAGRLDITPGSAILDVGAGTGVFIPFLLKKAGDNGRLVCLDFAEKMLQKARVKNFQGNIEYICADISDCRLGDGLFDAVVCYSSFPHFPHKLQALQEIHRLLKAGGKLFICHTSSRESVNAIHINIRRLTADLIPAKEEMLTLLSAASFQEININEQSNSYLARATKR